MARGKSQLIGAAGQFYLSYGLAVREMNASLTLGNAPSVDVVATSPDALRSLSFQVKTSRNAYRRSRYGREGYEWDVGAGAMGKWHESFWYAFVDLREKDNQWNPIVFFVPSLWVKKFLKPGWSRYMYFLPTTATSLTSDRWDHVQGYLAGKDEAINWANSFPKDKLVEWGKKES